jgi:hypothetical protein
MCHTGYVRKNLTLTIEEELLRDARRLAVDRDTSVNELVRNYLGHLVRQRSRARPLLRHSGSFGALIG